MLYKSSHVYTESVEYTKPRKRRYLARPPSRAWALATACRLWTGLTICLHGGPCVWLPFAAACCYTLFYLLMPTARLVCQRPSSNFPYFRIPLANFLLSRPNSVEYGNSKTTTLLPSLNVRVCEGHAIIRRRMNISETVQDRDNYSGMLH